ncbi:MAG: hypothetical protein U0401_31645 [Anaerolineae bacterium]
MVIEIIDLPRSATCHLPPRRWQVVLTVALIVVAAVVWAVT